MYAALAARLCVAHLVVDDCDECTGVGFRRPVATSFVVGVPLGSPKVGDVYYAVTARHVVREVCAESTRPGGPQLYLRVNKGEAGYEDIATDASKDWVVHPSTDVAVARLPGKPHGIVLDCFIDEEDSIRVGEGDDVLFMGLFIQSGGLEANEPIARFGRVSRPETNPRVLVHIDTRAHPKVPVEAFLVEALSWGGQSGSPAFLHLREGHIPTGKWKHYGHEPWLLGLLQGHAEIGQPVIRRGQPDTEATVDMNAGIAIVIPAWKILETLKLPELEAERERLLREFQSS